jgi:hypothetical protein
LTADFDIRKEDAVGDEGVVLTDREREALAGLAQSIGDPWLARQLVGQDTPSPHDKKRRLPGQAALQRLNRAATTSVWVGLALLVAGAVLAVTTFAHSTVVASLGLVLMGAGLWRLAADQSEVIVRRLTERRIPAAGPPPPRTPPEAV